MPLIEVSIESIVQTHPCLDYDLVHSMKNEIIRDQSLEGYEPLYCKKINDKYYIFDGAHRYEAMRQLGYETAIVEYFE